MRKNKKRFIVPVIILVVFLLIFGYIKMFNGHLIYFSTGLKKDVLMKVDNEKDYVFEAKILMSDAKTQYENLFGNSVWEQNIDGNKFEDYIKDQIRTKLIRVRCMNSMAKDKGIVLSREEKDNVSKASEKYYKSLSEEQIKDLNVTQDKLTEMFSEFAIARKLYQDVISTMNFEISYDDARVIQIQYIVSSDRQQIENAKNELNNGSSFFAIAKEVNADGEYELELKRGVMDSNFEEAAFNLKSTETSDIVEAADKYYIIRCISDNDKVKTEINRSAMIEDRQLDEFNKTFEGYEADKYIEWNNKVWDSLKLSKASTFELNFEDTFNEFLKK